MMYIWVLSCVDRQSCYCYLSSRMILCCYLILFSCYHEVMLKRLVIFNRLGHRKYILVNRLLFSSFLGWVRYRNDKHVTHSRCDDI